MAVNPHYFVIRHAQVYYWFRLPMLFGFADLPNNSALIDLTDTLPVWFPVASQIVTTAFFAWFMLVRDRKSSWSVRPTYSTAALTKGNA